MPNSGKKGDNLKPFYSKFRNIFNSLPIETKRYILLNYKSTDKKTVFKVKTHIKEYMLKKYIPDEKVLSVENRLNIIKNSKSSFRINRTFKKEASNKRKAGKISTAPAEKRQKSDKNSKKRIGSDHIDVYRPNKNFRISLITNRRLIYNYPDNRKTRILIHNVKFKNGF